MYLLVVTSLDIETMLWHNNKRVINCCAVRFIYVYTQALSDVYFFIQILFNKIESDLFSEILTANIIVEIFNIEN